MRNLGAIVGILLGIVGNAWQDRSTGSSIALQLVGDDLEWLLALTAQQSAKEPLGCTLIAARLQQNINDITIAGRQNAVRANISAAQALVLI